MPFTPSWPPGLPRYMFPAIDFTLVLVSAYLASFLRFGSFELPVGYTMLVFIQGLLVVVFSFMQDAYQPWRGKALSRQLGIMLFVWLLSFAVLALFLWASKEAESYSRLWLGIWCSVSAVAVLIARYSYYMMQTVYRRRGYNSRRILVVGRGINFQQMLGEFAEGNRHGYQLDTVIDFTTEEETIGKVQTIIDSREHYDECWLCLPLKDSSFVTTMIHALRHSTIDIRFMPGLRDLPLLNHKVTFISGFYSLDISCSPMNTYNRVCKSIEDKVIGSLICLLILPVCLMIAVAVKLSSPGPVLFKQHRHGRDGKLIKVYKFRSMYVHGEDGGKVIQATKGDLRVTRVGAFLRRTSLDELPQFFNVLQGGMSIVGPRPHALAHNEYYMELVESYMKRHKVKPGITGLAQVRGFRGETDTLDKMQRRVECDLEYMNNWSIWLDLKIIFLTVFKGFVGKTAY